MTSSILSAVRGLLQASASIADAMAWDAWVTDTGVRGERVKLYRDYVDGVHRARLTDQMAKLLRIEQYVQKDVSPFNSNHMDTIVQTLVDRLELEAVLGGTDAESTWAADLARDQRLDGLQLRVHEAAVRDGDAFVMVSFDNDTGTVRLVAEDAYDGYEGVLPIYAGNSETPSVALKIWHENIRGEGQPLSQRSRINVYYPDRIEKYVIQSGGELMLWRDNPTDPWPYRWSFTNGEPIGVPLIHFANNPRNNYGRSAIDDAIPLQDALNRVLVSMVMATELTGFPIRTAVGTKPPAAITPGMWVAAFAKDKDGNEKAPIGDEVTWLASIKYGQLDSADLGPFLDEAYFLIDQMYHITRTPEKAGPADASGEALKQREIGLLGKVRRAHIAFGNAWENAFALAARVADAFGTASAPTDATWSSKWKTGEIRDAAAIVAAALSVADRVDERTFLEMIAPAWGWDTAKIDTIMLARQSDQQARLKQLGVGGLLPSFTRTTTDDGDDEPQTGAA